LVRTLTATAAPGEVREGELNAAIKTLRSVTAAGIVVYGIFQFAEFSIAFWNPGVHSPNVTFLLFGGYWPVFWILHVLLGVLVPLGLLAGSSRGLWALASILVIVGFAAARMAVLVPGQIAGQIPGLQAAFQDVRLTYSYHPTSMEYLVACFMVATAMGLFYVGAYFNKTIANRVQQKA
jgi:molybdopterin-containing oxidoreductase family membrane subunit